MKVHFFGKLYKSKSDIDQLLGCLIAYGAVISLSVDREKGNEKECAIVVKINCDEVEEFKTMSQDNRDIVVNKLLKGINEMVVPVPLVSISSLFNFKR